MLSGSKKSFIFSIECCHSGGWVEWIVSRMPSLSLPLLFPSPSSSSHSSNPFIFSVRTTHFTALISPIPSLVSTLQSNSSPPSSFLLLHPFYLYHEVTYGIFDYIVMRVSSESLWSSLLSLILPYIFHHSSLSFLVFFSSLSPLNSSMGTHVIVWMSWVLIGWNERDRER